MKKTTVREYDKEGRLVIEIITEDDGNYWVQSSPIYPNPKSTLVAKIPTTNILQ